MQMQEHWVLPRTDWVNGELASVISLGTIGIETTTTIQAGDDITSDVSGKGKTATGDVPVNGRSLIHAQVPAISESSLFLDTARY